MVQLLIGCDPEVFLYNRNNRTFVSAYNRIPGSKNNPHKVKDGAVQVDGNALEFNTDPAKDVNEFTDKIASVYGQLKDMVPGYECVAIPHVKFSERDWKELPEEAKQLGCDPDWNAYTQKLNEIPEGTGDIPERDGAGHVHLGWTEGADINDPVHFEDCIKMVKQLDWYLGTRTCAWDKDDRRRSGYGKPGAFRVKPYGVEYRYPSNVWINTVEMQREVFEVCQRAFKDLVDGTYAPQIFVQKSVTGDPDRWVEPNLKKAYQGEILHRYLEQYAGINGTALPTVQFKNYEVKEVKKDLAGYVFNKNLPKGKKAPVRTGVVMPKKKIVGGA